MKQIKKLSIIAVVVILATSMLLLCACDNGKNSAPQPQTYTIQYTDDNGVHTITVDSGALYSLDSVPQRNEYEFLGLYDAKVGGTQYVDEDGNCVSAFKDNCNLVLYPQFRAKEYTLVLNYGEAAVTGMRQMTVSYGQTIAELPMNLFVENKTFAGWFTEQNKGGVQVADQYGVIPDKAKVTESIFDLSNQDGYIYLYAGFKGQEHLVTFYYGDDPTPEEMLIEYGTYITDVVTTRRVDGKAVMTWSKSDGDNAQNDIFTGKVTGPMVLYAYEYAPVIDFDANGGKDVTSIVRKAGAAIDLPVPERKDYTFVGWYTESGTGYSATYMPTNSIKLIAHWNAKLVFNTNGGTAVDDISEPVGTRVQLPTTEKEGYIFAGWYTDKGKEYTATSMPEESVKLNAKYYKANVDTQVIIESNKVFKAAEYSGVRSPSLNYALIVDLTKYYEQGIPTVLLNVHYDIKLDSDGWGIPNGDYHVTVNVDWYSTDIISDAYLLWREQTLHKSTSYITYSITKTYNMVSSKIYVCPWQSREYCKIRITDFYIDIEYPDTSMLY